MQWKWVDQREQELILVASTRQERARAERGIADLRMNGGVHGETTGARLQRVLDNGHFSWDVLKSLSSWCNSEGKYEGGVEPAHEVSRAFFNGQVLPRLTPFRGDGLSNQDAHRLFARFADKAGIWVDRALVSVPDGELHLPDNARLLYDQSTAKIAFKRKPVPDYRSLVNAYSDNDLASPFRSTVPLLAYWSTLERRLPDFATGLAIELPAPEVFAFEHTVPVREGSGRASQTDLMILLKAQSIAIEAKYTEPSYPIVREWLGSASHNRLSVLKGWLSLINGAAGTRLEVTDVLDCTYQLVHRAASACEPGKQRQAVVYQCFDPTQSQLNEYYLQLLRLSKLIDRPERLSFFLLAIGLRKSLGYQRLQDAWRTGSRNLSARVRQALLSKSLLDFDLLSARQA